MLSRLFAVYDYYWNTLSTFEPPRNLVEQGYSGLVGVDDEHMMEQLCLRAETYEKKIRSTLEGN